jgi:hypothetical protein
MWSRYDQNVTANAAGVIGAVVALIVILVITGDIVPSCDFSLSSGVCKDKNGSVDCGCVVLKAKKNPTDEELQKMLYTCSLLPQEQTPNE